MLSITSLVTTAALKYRTYRKQKWNTWYYCSLNRDFSDNFFTSEVKRIKVITNENGIHKLPNKLRLTNERTS